MVVITWLVLLLGCFAWPFKLGFLFVVVFWFVWFVWWMERWKKGEKVSQLLRHYFKRTCKGNGGEGLSSCCSQQSDAKQSMGMQGIGKWSVPKVTQRKIKNKKKNWKVMGCSVDQTRNQQKKYADSHSDIHWLGLFYQPQLVGPVAARNAHSEKPSRRFCEVVVSCLLLFCVAFFSTFQPRTAKQ